MNINKDEKYILECALNTESARVRRAYNAESSPAIKEILAQQLLNVKALMTKVAAEVVK